MNYESTRLMAARQINVEVSELPQHIEAGHVRLRLASASLCGTDLHYYRHFANAGFELQNPLTLGHEACAYVDNANDSALTTGDLVAINPIMACGQCEQCAVHQMNLCTSKKFPGSATTKPHIDGFFRNYFDFRAACCRPVASHVKPQHLTFAEPLACAMHAVNIGEIKSNSKVLITGCGPMGLLAVLAAAAKGAQVTATDVREEPVALATRIGARHGITGSGDALAALAGQFDSVIEASGSPHAFTVALDTVKRQGIVSILSNIQLSNTPIDLHRIMLKEINVRGSFQFNCEFEEAVSLIESGAIDLDTMIAARYPLSQATDAFELMLSGKAAGKILLDATH